MDSSLYRIPFRTIIKEVGDGSMRSQVEEVFFPTVFDGILGGGFKHLLFSSLPGEVNQFDEPIFQLGWFNHQLE